MSYERHAPAVWRLPLAVLAACLAAGVAFHHDAEKSWIYVSSETGIVEVLTFLFALAAIIPSFDVFRRRLDLPYPLIGWWFLFFAIGLVFLAGEEASWGQHWIGFQTPEALAGNIQGESNLHNLSQLTERIPKTIMSLAILVGGVIWPIYAVLRRRGPIMGGWFGWLLPSATLWPAAAVAFGLRIAERILVWNNIEDGALRNAFLATKEGVELFFVLYLLAYAISVSQRARALSVVEQRTITGDTALRLGNNVSD